MVWYGIGYTKIGNYWKHKNCKLLKMQKLEIIENTKIENYWKYKNWKLLKIQKLEIIENTKK